MVRRRASAVSNHVATAAASGLSSFETREDALLRMRSQSYGAARWPE
jgi:hypothetical protein